MNENIEVLVSNDNLVNGALNNNFGYQEKPENRKSIRAGLTFKSVGELMNEKIEINWLVKDFIMQDTLCILYAQPASGKSVAALSLAVSVATGTDWYGHQTQQGSVVYLAGEGQAGLKRRLKAIQLSRSISLEDAPLLVSNQSAMIDTDEGVNSIKNAIDQFGINPSLIVIDTLARAFSGDENSTANMNEFVAGCDAIRSYYPNCTILVVHHTGLSEAKRPRGSSALFAAVDTSFLLSVDGKNNIHKLSCDKIKDGKRPDDKCFELRELVLDDVYDSYSDPITSVVFEEVANYDAPSKMKLKVNDFLLMSILLSAEIGELNTDSLREHFVSSCSSVSVEAKRKAFIRSLSSVTELGLITQSGKEIIVNSNVVKDYHELLKFNWKNVSNTIH